MAQISRITTAAILEFCEDTGRINDAGNAEFYVPTDADSSSDIEEFRYWLTTRGLSTWMADVEHLRFVMSTSWWSPVRRPGLP